MTLPRILGTLAASVLLLASAHAATPRTLTAKIDRVSDGDTVTTFTAEETKLRLRLLGIDAPEVPHGDKPGQPYGEEARDYLDHLIGGKTVRVDAYGPDEHKRVLPFVWDEQIRARVTLHRQRDRDLLRCLETLRNCQAFAASGRPARNTLWPGAPTAPSPGPVS